MGRIDKNIVFFNDEIHYVINFKHTFYLKTSLCLLDSFWTWT